MSENFDIAVKIDPGNVLPTAEKVERSLAKAEAEAKQLRDTLSGMGRQVAAGMGQMSKAIEMEARMLEMATGKSRDFGFQLAALQKLHNDGRISAEQYIKTLEKMGVQVGHTADELERLKRAQAQQAMNTIGFSAAPQKQGGGLGATARMLGMAVGPAALGGAALGLGQQMESLAKESEAAHDVFVNLENTAKKLTDGVRSHTGVLAEQDAVAKKLHATTQETLGLYDAVGDAVDGLSLSHRELIDLQTTLGQAAIIEGKGLDAAAEVLNRMSVAMAAGADGAGQMQQIFRDFPSLGKALEQAWDTNREGVIKLVASGKKNFSDLVLAISAGSGEIKKLADDRATTHEKESKRFEEAVARNRESMGGFKAALEAVNPSVSGLEREMKGLNGISDDVAVAIGKVADKADQARVSMERAQKATRDFFKDFDPLGTNAAARQQADADFAGYDAATAPKETFGQSSFVTGDTKVYSDLVNQRTLAVQAAREEMRAVDKLIEKKGHEGYSAQQLAERKKQLLAIINGVVSGLHREAKAHEDVARNMERPGWMDHTPRSVSTSVADPNGVSGNDAGMGGLSFVNSLYNSVGNVGSALKSTAVDPMVEGWSEIEKAAKDAAEETRQAWAQGLGEIGGDFIRMAKEGEASFSDMVGAMMADIAKLMVKMAALEMIKMGGGVGIAGGILSGLIGGFAHGGHVVAGLPSAANGNMWRVGGGGSTTGDDHLFMARVSTGEDITVRTRQQQLAEAQWQSRAQQAMSRGGGGSGSGRTTVVLSSDPGEVTAAMGTWAGDVVQVKHARRFDRSRTGR